MSANARPTLTMLAPAGLAADLEAGGYRAPYSADPHARGLVVDRAGHALAPVGPVPTAPALRTKLADFLAATLNALEAEAQAIRAPLDAAHLQAVSEQSRALAEKLHRPRTEAAE